MISHPCLFGTLDDEMAMHHFESLLMTHMLFNRLYFFVLLTFISKSEGKQNNGENQFAPDLACLLSSQTPNPDCSSPRNQSTWWIAKIADLASKGLAFFFMYFFIGSVLWHLRRARETISGLNLHILEANLSKMICAYIESFPTLLTQE